MIQQSLQPAAWIDQAAFGILLTALVAAVGLALCLRALFVLGRQDRRQRGEREKNPGKRGFHPHCEQGTATIEFVLVMPVALFLILVLVQTMLLMAGQLLVHYAAFAAVRTAIVRIPLDLSPQGEPIDVISPDSSSAKFSAIERAAWIAVTPISGRDDSNLVDGEGFASALHQHYELLGEPTPRWVDTLAAERIAYAAEHTEVELMEVNIVSGVVQLRPISGSYQYGMKDPVAVRVVHRFNLSVPYIRAIFADGKMPTKYGTTAYTNIAALQMLTLEGVDPAMPMTPTLPRRDQRIQ